MGVIFHPSALGHIWTRQALVAVGNGSNSGDLLPSVRMFLSQDPAGSLSILFSLVQ